MITALALLTSMFFYIPQSALAGVIIMAVIDMVDFQLVRTLWKVKRQYLRLMRLMYSCEPEFVIYLCPQWARTCSCS